jgi:hypothetical protein
LQFVDVTNAASKFIQEMRQPPERDGKFRSAVVAGRRETNT